MTKSLYEDALADARQLRELAEETAKNKLVETLMPQIRDMVNKKIIGEEMDLTKLADVVDHHMEDEAPEPIGDFTPPAEPESKDGGEAVNGDINGTVINIDADGDVNIEMESEEESKESPVLHDTMAEALVQLLKSDSENKMIGEKLSRIDNTVSKLRTVVEAVRGENISPSQRKRINKSFVMCVKEVHKLHKRLILNEQATQEVEDLEHRLAKTIKEMKNMSNSRSRNIFDFLFEAGDMEEMDKGLEEAELSLELSDEEKEELAGAEDAAAVDSALDDILGDLEVSMDEAEPEGEAEAGDDEGEEEGEEAGDELDLGEADEKEEADMKETYEIDENMLRRELARLTEEAADEADQFGGGEDHGDAFVDVDEEDLINALADELGDAPTPDAGAAPAGGDAMPEGYRRRARANRRELAEARRVISKYEQTVTALKSQLVEMNLFNAKLLYANKLMQNKNLTMKQQRKIVEALDNAKTIREAKLLYKSLSESLVRRTRGNRLNEGSLRTLGSSSRSTRSAQPKASGVETDRWAVLAGIGQD